MVVSQSISRIHLSCDTQRDAGARKQRQMTLTYGNSITIQTLFSERRCAGRPGSRVGNGMRFLIETTQLSVAPPKHYHNRIRLKNARVQPKAAGNKSARYLSM